MKNFIIRLLQFFRGLFSLFRSRASVTMENILLRQQLITLKKENPRPRLSRFDRFFWVLIRMSWRKWKRIIVLVRPETVVKWHRMGFKLFWRFISHKAENPENALLKKEMRRLIRKMSCENSSWGAPRIHGELLKLGFRISERTVSRYMPRREPSREKIQKWLTFLHNHRLVIAAMDFFVVHTLFFRQLYCFFIIGHDMRTIIHIEATFHPTAEWQHKSSAYLGGSDLSVPVRGVKERLFKLFSSSQLQSSAYPGGSDWSVPARGHSLKYMVYDRDGIFSPSVTQTLKALGIDPNIVPISLAKRHCRAVHRNCTHDYADVLRGIQSCHPIGMRSELLDHVIVLNENHLLRLMREYVDYYHNDRTHYSLNKDSPLSRPIQEKPTDSAKVVGIPRLRSVPEGGSAASTTATSGKTQPSFFLSFQHRPFQG